MASASIAINTGKRPVPHLQDKNFPFLICNGTLNIGEDFGGVFAL
jgi:hypothetical protein